MWRLKEEDIFIYVLGCEERMGERFLYMLMWGECYERGRKDFVRDFEIEGSWDLGEGERLEVALV